MTPMKTKKSLFIALLILIVGGGSAIAMATIGNPASENPTGQNPQNPVHKASLTDEDPNVLGEVPIFSDIKDNEAPLPPVINKGLDWLSQAQHPSGGYGAGLHSMQGVKDPHAVGTDAATTAVVGLAYIRSGNTHLSGPYQKEVKGILKYLLEFSKGLNAPIQKANPDEVNIGSEKTIDLIGGRGRISNYQTGTTQPQMKLGVNVDATFASQFLTRMLPFTKDDAGFNQEVKTAIEACVKSIAESMNENGSMNGGTWAGVIQSSMANSALEQADGNGVTVDRNKLEDSRRYQRKNVDTKKGTVSTGDAAGVSLYALSSANRATAVNARKAKTIVEEAKSRGKLPETAEINQESLVLLGMDKEEANEWTEDYKANEITVNQLQQENVLAGFGNNGGEEFLSYMMTSEGLVISGGDAWQKWNEDMMSRLSKIQNPDGSWSGHHCITSPVFCTATAIMTLATDRDAEYIASSSK